MSELMITNDSYKILCYLWKMYLSKIDSGTSKTEARKFNSDFYKSDKELSNWHDDDIANCLNELNRNKLIKKTVLGGVTLLESAVVHMESKFKNNLNAVVDFISKFIP